MTVASLDAEDAALLYAEAPGTQLQIGALCFFEAEPLRDRRGRLRHAELSAHVEARLASLARFRQRIAPVLADLAAPMWVDDLDFDINCHFKRDELPPGGGTDAMRTFVDGLLGESMDVDHPLWDIHVVEGVDPMTVDGVADVDVVAVLLRAHHVMADGIALHAAATLLLDERPGPPRAQQHDWRPAPAPGAVDLLARALTRRARRQTTHALDLTRALIDPRRVVTNLQLVAQGAGSIRNVAGALAPKASFTGAVGVRRAFAWDSVPMADVVAAKRSCAATVNDVVLAIAAGALRRQMEEAGTFDPAGRAPRALVPIGAHASDASALSNHFSMTSVVLPVDVDDPRERVRVVHSRMHEHGTSLAESLMPHVFSIVDFVPPPVLRAVFPPVLAHQPLVNLAVSNIPGSRTPLFLWEARMLGLHPFINVVGNLGVIVAVLSYVDDLDIGVTVDPDVAGDPGEIAAHLRAAANELFALAR